ncbi:MAG: ABC transporter ATP-binding protein [Gemmatimonadales bacterium]
MQRAVASRLFAVARPYRGLFFLGMAATLTASLLDGVTVVILIPLLKTLFGTAGQLAQQGTALEALTDRLLGPLLGDAGRTGAATRLVLLLLVGLLLKNAATYASNQLSVAVQEGLVRDLRVSLYRHLLSFDLGFFQQTRQGHLISAVVADTDQSKQAVTAALSSFFQNLVVILSSLFILTFISWQLTVITLAAAPVLVLGIRALLRRLRRHAGEWAEERAQLTATVTERLAAIKLIRSYGTEGSEGDAFADQADRYRKRLIRTQRFSSLTHPVSEIFGGVVIILILVAAADPRVIGVTLSPEVTIGFLVVALRMMPPLKALSQFPTAMAIALASAERVFNWLDQRATERDAPGARDATFDRELAFAGVRFRYDGGDPVLDDVSFAVPKGRVVAIVGPSGAGKTTLLELVARFHDPTDGAILLDGIPLTGLRRASLRSLIGLVGQETVVLNDTVRANIAYGRPGATDGQVREAAAAANALEFIDRLPAGLDTVLGERGTRLSGGQRQRIAIARALLRDPPLLILDEATSALDTESERLVQEAIDHLMADRTVLVVAHRLATVQHADEILVLEAGRILERGSHAALLANGGLYRRLYDLQFRPAEEVA